MGPPPEEAPIMNTEQTVREALAAAGHTPWTSLADPADEPRFVVFPRNGEILVGLNLAAPGAEYAAARDKYLAALTAAGLTAGLGDDGNIHVAPSSGTVRVTIGEDPQWTFTAAKVEPESWNGWACPWFTEAVGREIAAVSKAAYDLDPEATKEYVEVRDGAAPEARFWLITPAEHQEWRIGAEQDATGTWLYGIGIANWTWEAICPRCEGPLHVSVTGPNRAGYCGPGYCHYALEN